MFKKFVFGALTLLLIPAGLEFFKFWTEKEEPVLQHVVGESTPMKINDKYISMYSVSLYNVGNKMAEDVRISFKVPQGKIDTVTVNQTLSVLEPKVVHRDNVSYPSGTPLR